jgi:hypothetical protein
MASAAFRFLNVSDLHFNPCYDTEIMTQLVQNKPEDWESIFQGSKIKNLSPYHQDTNYPLLSSFLEDAGKQGDFDFILFSGDFLGHHLQELYQQSTGDTEFSDYKAFIEKAVQFLAVLFQRVFPGKVFFPCIGNDDNYDGDYKITPGSGFLEMVSASWTPIMKGAEEAGANMTFFTTFPKGGYFTALLPGLVKRRLIVLNNIFMSQSYSGGCPPGLIYAQLAWFKNILNDCREKGEKAWVVFHEPLGINVYTSLHPKDKKVSDTPVPFMKTRYYKVLLQHLGVFHPEIEAIFSGHTHKDDFRVMLGSEDRPLLYNHITPAVSPVFGNNPGYQVYTVDPETFAPGNYTTRYLDLSTVEAGALGQWKDEYNFRETYGQDAINAQVMKAIWDKIGKPGDLQKNFMCYHNVSHADPGIVQDWQADYDGIVDITIKEFAHDLHPGEE